MHATLLVMSKLSHYDSAGRARMVDVGEKPITRRQAEATAMVELSAAVLAALPTNPKGNPLEVARFAGIQAAKRHSRISSRCVIHFLSPSSMLLTEIQSNGVFIRATAATDGRTGVEMEAMVAASVAALTIYDMCKAMDKGIVIREVVLARKSGGKSGDYRRIPRSDI